MIIFLTCYLDTRPTPLPNVSLQGGKCVEKQQGRTHQSVQEAGEGGNSRGVAAGVRQYRNGSALCSR